MGIGKKIRMQRLFAHPSGRFFSVALDHFIGYDVGIPDGLRTIEQTLARLIEGNPDAVTINKGLVTSAWEPYAGKVPLIIQSMICRPDVPDPQIMSDPEEVVRLGGDAIAVSMFVRGNGEMDSLRILANTVRKAAQYDLPVITHVYPRLYTSDNKPYVSNEPEDIAWAVRCGVEAGADVVKVPYCGDLAAHRQIISNCTVPVVSAGGPKTNTMQEALQTIADIIAAGARGATVGRNIWGNSQVVNNALAYKAVIHDGLSPMEAIRKYGIET